MKSGSYYSEAMMAGIVESGKKMMAEIKDSGNRREFETGAFRDIQTGKGRMDLIPMTAIIELSKHCEAGAVKYGERNIDKGIPQHSLIDSALRHIAKYTRGDKDENHLLAALWNIAWAVEQDVNRPELNDLPWGNDIKQTYAFFKKRFFNRN